MNPIPRISESEWEVLAVLWRQAPLTAAQVYEQLQDKDWKLSTIRTFLARLEKKGVVRLIPEAAANRYTPIVSKEACVRDASQSFLNRVFDGATAALLVHFARSKALDPKELEELEAILKRKKEGK